MSAGPVCCENPSMREYSLCGVAYDAFDTGDAESPVAIAKKGQTITCPDCRNVIAEVKSIKHWKQP